MVGKAKLVLRNTYTDPREARSLSPAVMEKSTGITGFWNSAKEGNPTAATRTTLIRAEFLIVCVFFRSTTDELLGRERNKLTTNCVIRDLGGAHMPSSVCKENDRRSILS